MDNKDNKMLWEGLTKKNYQDVTTFNFNGDTTGSILLDFKYEFESTFTLF